MSMLPCTCRCCRSRDAFDRDNRLARIDPTPPAGAGGAVACSHEAYQGECMHCGVPIRNGRPLHPSPAAALPERAGGGGAHPDASDRAVLLYLMQQFDGEVHVCPCGREDETADCDSAHYLRQYLASHPFPKPALNAPPAADGTEAMNAREVRELLRELREDMNPEPRGDDHGHRLALALDYVLDNLHHLAPPAAGGMVLVPREPTEAMLRAGRHACAAEYYRAMLAAAPRQDGAEGDVR
jgi:hypothetical protein